MSNIRSIGEKLKIKRKTQGISLDQISTDTKIRKEYLEAIENDEYDKFDSHVYAKGFIKNYAKYVGLKPEPLIAIYRRDFENTGMKRVIKKVEDEEEVSKTKFDEIKERLNFSLTTRQIAAIISILIVFVFTLLVTQLIENVFQPPILKISAPIEVSADYVGTFQTPENQITVKGEVESGTFVKINEVPITLKPGFIFESDPIPVTDERNMVIVKAVNQLGSESVIELEIIHEEEEIEKLEKIDGLISIQNTETSLKLVVDGKIVQEGKVYPDDEISFSAKNKVKFESSAPKSVMVKIGEMNYVLEKPVEFFRLVDGVLERE